MHIENRWRLGQILLITMLATPQIALAKYQASIDYNQPNQDKFESQTTNAKQPLSGSSTDTDVPLKLIQVGEADMDVLWFDVYLAKLYSIDGIYQPRRFPLMLDIEYHRDISAQELIDATIDQWHENGISSAEINQIKSHLTSAWPDVKQNDRLSFIIHNEQQAEFLFNDKPFYQLADQRFSEAFIGIWLSEKTTHPKLRKQLIGAK
ncbi:chalcone isomerase family protein [Shewanella subflava]|uniref:Chalcone isomerase family protein n=1 Tax=Shewanella subflava TaxID=2986476 RepID=A0ABT3IB45_9GAMM|nr:chalcone isomerase family protein [Shewanella subflava]MCW3173283.1 chalcone isomerase family protein [Shewanella subflava]